MNILLSRAVVKRKAVESMALNGANGWNRAKVCDALDLPIKTLKR